MSMTLVYCSSTPDLRYSYGPILNFKIYGVLATARIGRWSSSNPWGLSVVYDSDAEVLPKGWTPIISICIPQLKFNQDNVNCKSKKTIWNIKN